MNYQDNDHTEIVQADEQKMPTCLPEDESQRISCVEYIKQYDISQVNIRVKFSIQIDRRSIILLFRVVY